jgi:DNA-binding XRE family transcriptional regulator
MNERSCRNEQKRNNAMKNEYIERMLTAELTQAQLGKKLCVARQTIVAIENRRQPLSWNMYLAIVCVFQQFEGSKKLLDSFELFDVEYIQKL